MSYRDLYVSCQQDALPVSRTRLREEICRLTALPRPRVLLSGLNPEIVRGYYLTSENQDHSFAKHANGPGGAVIVVARQMNYCWRRFVEVKEMMHMFDSGPQLVGTPEGFESLISEFVAPSPERSEAMQSETRALWMALGVLCPEAKRQEFSRARSACEVTDRQIAEVFKIPEQYVSNLMSPRFTRNIEDVTLKH